MKRAFLIFIAVTILTFITTEATDNSSTIETERYKLFEYAFKSLNTIVWSERVYQEMTIYLNDLKQWSFNNSETFRKSNIYYDLQSNIDTNLNILNELKSDPDNCKKQMKLQMEHGKIKMFQQTLVEDEDVLREWMQKDRILLRKLLSLTIRPYKKFYVKLQAEVEIYLNNLDDDEKLKEQNLQRWCDKFAQETDFVEKLFLITEFMGLFYQEKSKIEAECMVTYNEE